VYCKDLNKNRQKASGRRYATAWLRFALVVVCAFVFVAQADGTLAAHKQALIQKLDSIDLEKQFRKRKGEPMADLEKAAESIKDSVAIIKTQIPRPGFSAGSKAMPDTVAKSPVAAQGLLLKILPKSMFDWMIAVVGFIAIVSGAVLFVGIFGMLTKGFKKKKVAPKQPKTLQEIFPRSYASEAYAKMPKVQNGHAEEKEGAMQVLRKRIERTETTRHSDGPVLATEEAAADGGDVDDVKNRVMAAAKDGCDVLEISRRFQMSADQVSLILRMFNNSGPSDKR